MIERDPKLKGENGVSICCYWNASRSNETSYYKLEKDIITIIIERENARFWEILVIKPSKKRQDKEEEKETHQIQFFPILFLSLPV